ncbi:hypothetical protein [Nocardia sp. NBC_01009]|uniref:hypothetical protein n=1 Tax=Nocardia sp. NBC_01009 TaxID=2975996 RepID=UPI00386B8A6D
MWIHGRAFVCGSNARKMHAGNAFAHYRVGLISINYRLGIWGSPRSMTRRSTAVCMINCPLRWVRPGHIDATGSPPQHGTCVADRLDCRCSPINLPTDTVVRALRPPGRASPEAHTTRRRASRYMSARAHANRLGCGGLRTR